MRSAGCRRTSSWSVAICASCSTASSRKPDIPFSPSALHDFLFAQLRLPFGTRFVVAYSGGLDSSVLLHAALTLRDAGYPLHAVHVHHHLQAAADDWAVHCRETCREWDVPCAVEHVAVTDAAQWGVEGAARRARYAVLARHVDARSVLLTAHQRDDQAETVLLHLLRGTGVRGLAGMTREGTFAAGRVVRPLLAFSRAELHAYALAHALTWIEDGSNRDPAYRRNFLRQVVLPNLDTMWPEAAARLARSAANVGDAFAVLDEVAEADAAACKDADGALVLAPLCALSPARRRNVLRYWVRAHFGHAPSGVHLRELEGLLQAAPRSGHAVVAWPGAEIHRYRNALHARRPGTLDAGEVDIAWDGADLTLPQLGVRLETVISEGEGIAQRWFDAAAIRVRRRQGGERCRLPGRGHRHTVKKLLQERQVPPWLRASLPMVYVGDALAAVGDLCVCAPFHASSGEPGRRIVVRELPEKVIE